jgi:hypothetical protein
MLFGSQKQAEVDLADQQLPGQSCCSVHRSFFFGQQVSLLAFLNTYTLVLLVFGSTTTVTLPLIVRLSSTKSMADVAGLIGDVDDGDCVIEGVPETPSVGTDDIMGEDVEEAIDSGVELVI